MRTLPERFVFAFLLLFFLAVGLLSYTSQSAAAGDIPLPEQVSTLSVPLNQIVTVSAPLNFVIAGSATPTATRTPTPINIGNTVWEDYDFDGRQDAGEPGMAGVTVQLWNSAKTQLIAQSSTNANGNYTVIAPLPGNYRIRVLLPSATDSFTNKDLAGGDDQLDSDINPSGTNFGFTDSFTLASNLISTTIYDAGIVRFYTPTPTRTPTPINIGNFIWNDIDDDGRQDMGEPGLGGVTVQLWNASKTQLIAQTVTNASGIYSVTAPLPGDYRIRVLLPGMMDSFSAKNQAGGDDQLDSDINPSGTNFGFTDTFTLANNVISTTIHDAGIQVYATPTPTRTPTPINIGNFVWDDIDHDGRQDAGEPGMAGVTVQLWNASKTQLLAQTVTNAGGGYTVIAPIPGDYRIRVLLPGMMDSFSPKDQAGGDNQLDSDINPSGTNYGFTDTFTLANNVISTTIYDTGIIRYATPTPTRTPSPINFGNFVWRDLNGNGTQDADEPGLQGVTVQLWNGIMSTMYGEVLTNASGFYTLTGPHPGNYRVRVLLPPNASGFSPKDLAGGQDTLDSDINPNGAFSGSTDVIPVANNVISITSLDAGIIIPLVFQPVTTLVFQGELNTIQLQPLATPTLPPVLLVDPPNICAGFRLTSPLDGLPNGAVTFYWDPAASREVTYQVTVMDEGRNILATYSSGNATSVGADISQQNIGGGFQLIVQVMALQNGQVVCTDERTILRAAPDPGQAPIIRDIVIPLPTLQLQPTRPPRAGGG